MIRLALIVLALGIATPALADVIRGQAERQPLNMIAIAMFGAFAMLTIGITRWAARRTRTASDFYTAGGGISGFQNGLAIAGDFMSAASFLGISAQIYSDGYDGLIYSIGFLMGWPIISFLIAEKLRNLGRYTFADVASYRFAQGPVRSFAAISTLLIVAFYLIAQMVGAGQLIKLLFGLSYPIAVVLVGVLMIVYVLVGGMTATTWIQISKAVFLLAGATFIALSVLWQFGFSLDALFARAVQVKTDLALAHGVPPADAAARGQSIMGPGNFIKDPISALSFGLALLLGTAGLPHILMRFFTVPDAQQARQSVLWATTWIGYFYLLTFVIGFGAIVMVATDPVYQAADGGLRGGLNMAAIHLAHAVGGDLFLGFISAVAFATILAVVAGLTLSGASAVSHDLYASVWRRGRASSADELKVSRITTLTLGIVAIALGILFEKQNVAFMVSLAFALAASGNVPALILSLYWRGCTGRGVTVGGLAGLLTAFVLTLLSPAVWEQTFGLSDAPFPYSSPAIISVPLGFFMIWLISVLDRSATGDRERQAFRDQQIRSETGLGASAASDH